MKLNDIYGYYNSSFFTMVFETDESILGAINKYSATFAHEFIHYIQDIIFPYNIRMNLSRLRWFSNIQQSAIRNGYITCPFNDWDGDLQTTLLQFNMTIGKNANGLGFINEVWKMEDAITYSEKATGFDNSYSMKHREFNVYTYYMPINNGISYNLGARDLLEYIAHKIEAKHFVSDGRSPQLPYESVDLLFERYGLSYVSDTIRACSHKECVKNHG